jgi:hypothetical protein
LVSQNQYNNSVHFIRDARCAAQALVARSCRKIHRLPGARNCQYLVRTSVKFPNAVKNALRKLRIREQRDDRSAIFLGSIDSLLAQRSLFDGKAPPGSEHYWPLLIDKRKVKTATWEFSHR